MNFQEELEKTKKKTDMMEKLKADFPDIEIYKDRWSRE